MDDVDLLVSRLLHPDRLWSRSECLARPSPVPKTHGLYGWYFRAVPSEIDVSGCVRIAGCTLLYVGIAPTKALGHNGLPSTSSLRSRVRMHYAGNAESSTLRLTLCTLLAAELSLSRDWTRRSKSFGAGEAKLSEWMDHNAYVTCVEHPVPWSIERPVIVRLDLPLNLAHNRNHPFWMRLTAARSRRPRS